jgi:hypothetical protein
LNYYLEQQLLNIILLSSFGSGVALGTILTEYSRIYAPDNMEFFLGCASCVFPGAYYTSISAGSCKIRSDVSCGVQLKISTPAGMSIISPSSRVPHSKNAKLFKPSMKARPFMPSAHAGKTHPRETKRFRDVRRIHRYASL